MYRQIGEISEECREYLLESLPKWNQNGGTGPRFTTNYRTTDPLDLDDLADDELTAIIPRKAWEWAWAIGLEAETGYLHVHKHPPQEEKDVFCCHVVLQTNEDCECVSDGVGYFLEERGVYLKENGDLHGSVNLGDTDRVHLVIFVKNAIRTFWDHDEAIA